jgi:hypothetical protein
MGGLSARWLPVGLSLAVIGARPPSDGYLHGGFLRSTRISDPF